MGLCIVVCVLELVCTCLVGCLVDCVDLTFLYDCEFAFVSCWARLSADACVFVWFFLSCVQMFVGALLS